MIQPRVTPIDEPRHFEPHELFFSFTDSGGRIRYGNRVFTRVSGYEEADLLGKPHNVIRHPDVPRCVFRLLWDYLEAGRTIAAYVKNLAADGRYYWVLAVVMPSEDGYLSVRLKPSSTIFDAVRAAYDEVVRFESAREIEHGKQAAIEQSLPRLSEIIAGLGYGSYDDFMRAALRAELEARATQIGEDTPRVSPSAHGEDCGSLSGVLTRVNDQLSEVFGSLDVFERLSNQLAAKRANLVELGPSLAFLALNSHISASRLGDQGAVLSVVSRRLGESSKEADRLIGALMERMEPICDNARAIAFEVAVAQLEAEVCRSFVEELLIDADETQPLVLESLDALVEELTTRSGSVLRSLERLGKDLFAMIGLARQLTKQIEQMRTAQLNGKIDIASRKGADGFAAIFEDVAAIVDESREDCDDVIELLSDASFRLSELVEVEQTLDAELGVLRGASLAT